MSTAPLSRTARLTGAGCLVATALLMLVSVLLQPDFTSDGVERLAGIDDAGAGAVVSLFAFAVAQLPFAIGFVIVALAVRSRAPRLAVVGGVLAVLGAFGHTVFSGLGFAQVEMAASADRAEMAPVVEAFETGAAVPFMAMGLIGTVVGILLIGIALFRTSAVPRWIPAALWAFLVVEFVGTGLSEWAIPASGLLYLAALTGLAVELTRPANAAEPHGESAALPHSPATTG